MKKIIKNKIIGFTGIIIIGIATFASIVFAGTPILSINPTPTVTSDSATFSVFYDVNGDVLTSVAVRYGTNTLMQTNTSSQTPSSNSGTFSFTANNLSSGTTYYFQAIGISSSGTVTSSRYTFTTKSISAPTVQTYSNPSNIAHDSATISGFYSDNGYSISNLYFEYGPSSNLGSTKYVSASGSSGNISTTISGLQSNTKYWYRLVATNQGGTTRGSIYTFTTSNNGNNNNGNGNNNYPSCYYDGTCYFDGSKWVYYNDIDDDDDYPNCYYDGTCYFDGSKWVKYKNKNKDNCIFGYECNPICYYFGNCKNNNQNNYLNVDTNTVSNINSNSATFSGFVYSDNSSSAYFEYGTNPNLGYSTKKLYSNNSSTNYMYTVYGLKANTTYYFRIVGESNGNVQIGDIVSFKTGNNNAVSGTVVNTNNTNTTNSNTLPTINLKNLFSRDQNTQDAENIISKNNSNQNNNFLASGAGFSGSFFPGTILGWLVIVLFILILVLIAKRVFSNYRVVKNS